MGDSLPFKEIVMATRTSAREIERKDANRDPLTGAPGAHPVGAGVGTALGGAAAGAAAGSVAGPVGTVAGAVIGGVAGGYAGKAIAESVDPTAEEAYWRENYPNRPYYSADVPYDAYSPAYRYGWEARGRYPDRSYLDAERDLEAGWPKAARGSNLGWDKARYATQDAWNRVEETIPGDADRDADRDGR
jgi:hypothetical protein